MTTMIWFDKEKKHALVRVYTGDRVIESTQVEPAMVDITEGSVWVERIITDSPNPTQRVVEPIIVSGIGNTVIHYRTHKG